MNTRSVQRKIEIVIELLDEIASELKIDPAKGKITIEKISEMELYELEEIDLKEVEEFRLEWIMKGKG